VPRVRLINEDGTVVGIVATRDAQLAAEEKKLDLVEVSPNADPPVCRIMDYGKFCYEQNRKDRGQRKSVQKIKEVKFHTRVDEHDYLTKIGHIRGFLEKGNKVKVSLMFRGRENAHKELGFEVINRVIKDCESFGYCESAPRLMGRNVIAMLGVRANR
jgi:translation initiation factor IF-3